MQKPPPGRLIASVIYSSYDALVEALPVLERRFGPVEMETVDIPCQVKDLYKEEMGSHLQRRFFCFERPVERDTLPEIKKVCSKIEPLFADQTGDFFFRTVNVDPGILTPDNLTMASHRGLNCRIYLRDGVYAELVLIYARDRFARLPWTCGDFCHDEAIDLFMRARSRFELLERPPPERVT